MRTIHEIQTAFGSGIGRTLNAFAAERDRIQGAPEREYAKKVPYYVEDPDERRQHIRRAKEADVRELHSRLRREAALVLERYPDEVERRREELQETLFSGRDISTEAMTRVATATDEELERMYAAAAHSHADELARTVYAEATRRNLPDLRWRIAEEQGGVYAEWETMPSPTEVAEKVNQQRFILDQQMSPRLGANAFS
jgi:hypothetical protein